MLNNRTKFRLFLLLCVMLFTIVAAVGCQNGVDATYIRGWPWDNDWDSAIPLIVVDNHPDLVAILGISTPEKYDDDFFKTKSLLFFGIVEESGGCVSEIKSYAIKNNTISVHIKTKKHGVTANIGYWCFMLELTKKEVESFKNVKLFHDGKDITCDYDGEEIVDTANLIDKAREEYLNRYVKSKREDAVIEDVVLDEYLGTYKGVVVCVFSDKKSVFTEQVLRFEIEDLVFTWSYGYDILVYDGTGFMDLQMAYNNSKLTYEDLLNIHKLSQ